MILKIYNKLIIGPPKLIAERGKNSSTDENLFSKKFQQEDKI